MTAIKEALISKRALGISGICGVVFVLMGLVSLSGVLESWELRALDLRLALYHRLNPPEISEPLLIVKIDQKCQGHAAFGGKTWHEWTPDEWLVPLASALTSDVKHNAIGVLVQLIRGYHVNADFTSYLSSVRGHLFPATEYQQSDYRQKGILTVDTVPGLPQGLQSIAEESYFVSVIADQDGRYRWAQLVVKMSADGKVKYSLLVHLVKHHLNADIINLDEARGRILLIKDGKSILEIPIDSQGRMHITFASRNQIDESQFDNISLLDLIEHHKNFREARLSETINPETIKRYQERYQGRIALVGLATARPSRLHTPQGSMLYLLLQTNALNTILS